MRPQCGRLCAGRQRLTQKHILTVIKTVQYTKSARRGEPMMTVWAVLGGFVLDALFGDPAWLPHPVVYMGKAISKLEKFLAPPSAQNASGRAAGRCHRGVLPAGGHLFAHRARLVCWGGRPAPPAAGAGRPDVLVRAGAGRPGPGAGEHQCLYRAQKKPTCPGPAKRSAGSWAGTLRSSLPRA